jgi:hypothetical protein
VRPKWWQITERLRWWMIDRLIGKRACAFNLRFDPKGDS